MKDKIVKKAVVLGRRTTAVESKHRTPISYRKRLNASRLYRIYQQNCSINIFKKGGLRCNP